MLMGVTTLNKNDATMEQENLDVENLQKQLEVVRALCRTKEKEIEKLKVDVVIYKERAEKTRERLKQEMSRECAAKESAYQFCIKQMCEAMKGCGDY